MDSNTSAKAPEAHKKFEPVFESEKQYLGIVPKEKIYGLAISGGGIRSASFGLGVMQGLVAGRKLEKMHYMSTVSGGGYLGTALTWALHQGGHDAGTTPEKFPLGHKKAHNEDKINENRNKLLDYIRQHSSYLTPTEDLGLLSFGAVVLRGITMSLLVYVSALVAIMGGMYALGFFDTTFISELFHIKPNEAGHYFGGKGIFIPTAVFLMIVFMLMNMIYSVFTYIKEKDQRSQRKYRYFLDVQIMMGTLWKIVIPLLLIGSIPFFLDGMDRIQKIIVASGSTTFGFIVSIWQYRKAQKEEESPGVISDVVIYLGAFALIYGLLWGSFMIGRECVSHVITVKENGVETLVRDVQPLKAFICCTALLLVSAGFGFFVNLNLMSPSRIWRNRLMEAFMPEKEAVENNEWRPANSANDAMMEDMCADPHRRPYHIINTNLILVNSGKVKLRARGGDNFIISRLFSGSSATGWRDTSGTHADKSRHVSLATAMATSAAAVNPNAGVSGEGATRNRIVSLMFSILNIRLGLWTTNPNTEPWPMPPNFFIPGISSELVSSSLSETRRNIQLSDGGHFENLAIYELLRRRLDVIVISDGGADPGFNFDDLANAVEKVRVDFGTKIVFRKGYELEDLLPASSGTTEYIKRYGIARRGFAIADVEYSDGNKGILFYIKLTMINGLPTDVYSYKGVNPAFPHESTADQFFDEKQFEAYRELGYNITNSLLAAKEGDTLLFE
jgi:hypothetical protein